MPDSILLIDTMQLEQGKLEEFEERVKSSLAFVRLRSTTRRIGG
jgi:hypothetical protein